VWRKRGTASCDATWVYLTCFHQSEKIFEVWAHVLMPWSAKLLLAAALALPTVKATAADVSRDRFWNKVHPHDWPPALLLLVAVVLLTYYEHLYEPADGGTRIHTSTYRVE
jgi:hypothetical protein